ncbi:mCG145898, partial [Mus musculus]
PSVSPGAYPGAESEEHQGEADGTCDGGEHDRDAVGGCTAGCRGDERRGRSLDSDRGGAFLKEKRPETSYLKKEHCKLLYYHPALLLKSVSIIILGFTIKFTPQILSNSIVSSKWMVFNN